MFPDAPPTHRIYTFAEVKAVPEPIPMQLFELGVPNNVAFAELYVCQPPYVDPLVPTRVVQVRPDVDNVPVIVEFPVMVAPPLETVKAPVLNVPVMLEFPVVVAPPLETVIPARDVNPVHTILFVESKPIAIFPKLGPCVRTSVNVIGEFDI